MKPAWALIAITLTFGTDITASAANYAVTKLFTALRDKAANNGWNYWLILWPCDRNPYTGEPVRLHYHGTLLALPGWTVANWIQDYWFTPGSKREPRNGYVFNRTVYNRAGWEEEYIPNQAAGSPRQQSNTRTESRDTTLASVASVAVPNANYILVGSVYEKDCNSVNTPFVSGFNSNYSITQPSVPGYPAPVYDADNCCPCEEPPYLDSFPADVVAEIVAGEEMYSSLKVVVVDKQPASCVENVPGSSNQASRDAGSVLDALETTTFEIVDAIVKIDSPPPGNLDAGGKPQKGDDCHAQYNPAVTGFAFDMPGLFGYIAAFQNVALLTPIRAGPRASPATAA